MQWKTSFKQSVSDPCIYTSTMDDLFILAVYVDNILLAAKSQQKIDKLRPISESDFVSNIWVNFTIFLEFCEAEPRDRKDMDWSIGLYRSCYQKAWNGGLQTGLYTS